MEHTLEDLITAIAVLSDADLDDGSIDQIDEFVINAAKTKMQLETILDAEENGELSEEEADNFLAASITEGADAQLDIFDLEINLIPEEAEEMAAADKEYYVVEDPELENLKAEFSAVKQEQELSNILHSLESQADRMVVEGNLTPYEKTKLFGEYSDRQDNLALFSAVCNQNGIPYETQIDRIAFYLEMCRDRGQVMQFAQFSAYQPEVDPQINQEAEQFANEFISRNGII